MLLIADIFCDPDFNSRGRFTLSSLESLRDSIKVFGLQMPVIVQPIEDTKLQVPFKWRLLAGFRRYTVYRDIMREQMIPATVLRGLSDHEAAMVNFQENSERAQLSTLDEATWLAKHFEGASLREVSAIVGRDTRWVHQRQRLAMMPAEVQAQFATGLLSLLDIDSLAKLQGEAARIKTADLIIAAKKARDTNRVTKLRTGRQFRPRRTKKDIWRMNGRLMKIGNTALVTRFLAWAAGDVSDQEIEKEIAQISG